METFPLYRSVLNWEWFKDQNVLQFYIYCLLKANESDISYKGIEVKRGSFITTLKDISEDTGLSMRQTRTCIDRLKTTQNLTSKTTNKFTILTICKYDDYNNTLNKKDIKSDKQNDKQTTNKNRKNDKQKQPQKISFSESEIYDLKAFSDAFPEWSKEQKRYYFDAADDYSNQGNKYINWKSAINNWALRDKHNQRNFFYKNNQVKTAFVGRVDYSDWLEE
jgi:hypothetical protein